MVLDPDEKVTITDFLGRVRQYTTIQPLGDGYLANVYLMRDLQDSSSVVLKVLKERHVQAVDKAADFLHEADLLQELAHHPEVVELRIPSKGEIILGEGRRLPCILQEYVSEPYHSVPELVQTGLSEQTGLAICRQFAALLDHINSRGIIYADLKPEHIYWDGSQIKVIDWNVVKDLSTEDGDALQKALKKELRDFGQAMYYLFTGRATVRWVDGPAITALVSGHFSGPHIDFSESTTGQELSLGTKLIIERSLWEDEDHRYQSAAELEEALAQHLLRVSQATSAEPAAQTRAAISKGLAAMQAGDYEDAINYFEGAAYNSPGLILQSYVVAARIQQDEHLPDAVKDQIEESLTLFRMAFQEGDLTTALDALASSKTSVPDRQEIELLHQLTTQVADATQQAEAALSAADYEAARQLLRQARTLEPTASFLRERLQTVEAFYSHLETGEQALEAGQFSEAAAAFETLLNHMPQSTSIEQQWTAAKLGQGQAALERNAFTDARRAFEAVLERQPEHKRAQTGLAAVEKGQQRIQQLQSQLAQGRTAFQVGDYEKALECINTALELEPNHAEARQLFSDVQQALRAQRERRARRWLEKGHQAMAEDAYAEAIQCFEQAATLDPESEANVLRARAEADQARAEQFQALLHKAHAAFRGEDYNTAVRYFEEAVDLQPEALDARRGLTLARQRQAEVRGQELRSLLAAGRAALSAGNYEDALQHFERATELGSDSEVAGYIEKTFQIRDLVQSAQAAEARGELQEALKYYLRAVEIDPLPGLEAQLARTRTEIHTATREQVDALIERATAHLESAPEQALTWLEQAHELDPAHEQVTELLLEVKEDIRQRKLELRRVLETGQAALDAGDADGAEQAFAKALALDSELEVAQASRLQAQQLRQHLQTAKRTTDKQDFKGAVTALEQALEIAPDSPGIQQRWREARSEALLQQARCVSAEGAHTDALAHVEEALTLNPEHPTGHDLREEIEAEAEASRRAEAEAEHRAMAEQVETLTSTAEAKIEAGDYHAAWQAIESALELMPEDPELARRRRAIGQQKARQDRARALMNEGRRLEVKEHYADAAETYKIAAHMTPHAGLETEARARAEAARQKQRQRRWRHLLRRIVGIPTETEALGKD